MKRGSLLALALLSCASPDPSGGRVVTWGDRVVTHEESWDLDRLVLRAGARITARGAYLRVRTTELVIEGPVTIDARGVSGTPLTEPRWTSSGGALDDCDIAHRDWRTAADGIERVPDDTHQRGNRGGDAGSVTVIAQRVIGQPGDLQVDVRGGEGSPGRVFVCGCRGHDERAQAGAGPRGADGRWTFVQE